MTTNLNFFSHVNYDLFEAFSILQKKGHNLSVAIAAVPKLQKKIEKAHPKTVVFAGYADINSPSWLHQKATGSSLNRVEISLLDDNYSTLMHLMARTQGTHDLSQVEKDQYIRSAAIFAKSILKKHNINAQLFLNEPHQLTEYIVFLLGKLYGHKIFILQKTRLKNFCLLRNDIDGDVNPYSNGYSEETRGKLQKQLVNTLSKLREDCGTPPEYLSIKKARHEYRYINLRAHFVLRALREIGTRVHHFIKVRYNNTRQFEYEIWKSNPLKKLTRQLRAINSLSALSSQKLPKYFDILLALQCQPERAITPCATPFYNQLFVLDYSNSLFQKTHSGPVEKIVVKEHPSQLRPYQRAYLGRTPLFYENLAKDPRVVLAPESSNNKDLIERCGIVVGTSGNICFEAYILGKPVIALGHAWFCYLQYFKQNRKALSDGFSAAMIEPPNANVIYEASVQLCQHIFEYRIGEKTEDQARIISNAKTLCALITANS